MNNDMCIDFSYFKKRMVGYDNTIFMAFECETVYYEDLIRWKLLPERGISMEQVPEKLLKFDEKLAATGWRYFSPYLC